MIFDEDEEEFKVLAYFTQALQVLKIPESFSNRKIKKLIVWLEELAALEKEEFRADPHKVASGRQALNFFSWN